MEIELPPGTFLFEEVFERLPNVQIEIERVVPIRSEMLPFIWVRGEGRHKFPGVVEDLMPITHLEHLFEDDEALVFRLFWATDADTFFDSIRMTGLVIKSAVGTADGWNLTLQFDDQAAVAAFQSRCEGRGIEFTLNRVRDISEWQANRYDLTDSQRATLLRAYELGYFQEPRKATVEELAAEFDVSPRAMSGRLRRGLEQLIAETLLTE